MRNDLNNAITPKTDSAGKVSTREVLKLSELDSELLSDISNMFGMWKEADHCDKDIR